MVDVLRNHGYQVIASDLFDRGANDCVPGVDFLEQYTGPNGKDWHGDIITNPPYKYAQEFVETALRLVRPGGKVAMLLRLNFLEGCKRQKMFKVSPPKKVYVFSNRVVCARNGDFALMAKSNGSAVCFAWFVWERGYCGDSVIGWLNTEQRKNND